MKTPFLLLFFSLLLTSAAAERVISLSPNLTEAICLIGGKSLLAGRTDSCTTPSSVTGIPSVGKFLSPPRSGSPHSRRRWSSPLHNPGAERRSSWLRSRSASSNCQTVRWRITPLCCAAWAGCSICQQGNGKLFSRKNDLPLSAATPRPFRRMKKFPSCFSPESIRRSWPGGGVSSIR